MARGEDPSRTLQGAEDVPALSVAVVASRPLRLRWLLNALEEQTLDASGWEVVVGVDTSDPAAWRLLETHPLARGGRLRTMELDRSQGLGAKRNATWKAARGATVVFTDDDCRPPPDWLAHVVEAVDREGEAVVQGRTVPDPHEAPLFHAAPWARSQFVEPPDLWGQTCNIAYPRVVLERLGGFDDRAPNVGEDAELAARARAAGAPFCAAREMLTYHGVVTFSLPGYLRQAWRWGNLAYLFKRRPELRDRIYLWIFWKRTHVWLPPAVLAAVLGRRTAAWLLLALPWTVNALPDYGPSARGRIRSLLELPGRAAIDAIELAACARGSVKYKTLLL